MRTLAKIILSIALFGVVIGVSYLKSDLNTAQINDAVTEKMNEQPGTSASDETVPVRSQSKTETENRVPDQTAAKDDDAGKSAEASDTQSASADGNPPATFTVSQVVKTPETNSNGSRSENGLPENSPQSVRKPAPEPVDSAMIIADYYQGQLDKLPTDLTSYERKVALKEIRDEVCDYFHITPKRLNKIAKARKVRYP